MCGILVVVNKTRAVDVKKIENAGKLMQHRGPDCFGLNIISNNVVMTHNRLAIIDLNNRSNQPFVKNDLCLVYNGEIYNYKELIKEHDLKTNTASDTEVLLLMYEKYKEACLDYLNGMFGFAVYDLKKKELFVARDRLGVKPLYFSKTRDGIVIASEIAPILELIDDKSVDDFGIRQYRKLRMTVKGDTVYKNIKFFPAGHYYSSGCFHKYWDIDFSPKEPPSDEQLKALIIDACRIRKRADVAVGSYLSGGLDSTILSYILKPEFTWTVGFEQLNEFMWASLANRQLNSKHIQIIVSEEEFISTAEKMIKKRKEPLCVPNEVLIYLMTRKVKTENTVVLSGEGADELFWGYDRIFKWAEKADQLQIEDFDKYYCYGSEADDEVIDYAISGLPGYNPLEKIAYFFQVHHLHGLLRRLDNSTMLCSVEARVPFTDYRLVEMMAGTSFLWKMNGTVKLPLKRVFEDLIPKSIIERNKVGFPVPLDSIFRNKYKKVKKPFDKWASFNIETLIKELT